MAATLQEEFLSPREARASWVLRECSAEHIFSGYNWITATHTHARTKDTRLLALAAYSWRQTENKIL